MSELLRVATALRDAASAGEVPVLATVVRTEGSTYRHIGARLVLTAAGRAAGAISAGCLESDIAARGAALRPHAGRTEGREIVTYDARSPDDIVWGFGLGCNGLVEVLLEALVPDRSRAVADQLERCVTARQRLVLATVFRTAPHEPAQAGDLAMLWSGDAPLDGLDIVSAPVRAEIERTARAVLASGRPSTTHHALDHAVYDIAYEIITPTLRLAICGAGADAVPVAAAAKGVGWHVTLVDDRPAMASPERFPDADRIVVALPRAIDRAVATTDCDAAVVMSHDFESDLQYLRGWLGTDVPYVGVLGPRNRSRQLLATIESRENTVIPPAVRQRVHGPVGLDLGAVTPEEIALAIVAEIQAVRAGRAGGHLRDRSAPIHGDGVPSGA